VKLCLDGIWQEIYIDDYFPCDAKKNFPCFSFSKDGSLWINILEKCYAKAKGSYYLLEKGSYEQIIRELTGAPILIIDNSNENLLANIKEACSKKWIITASAGETEASRELLREVGLIPLHTYIIIDIYDLSQLDESNINFQNNLNISNSQLIFSNSNYDNILKIKNPWGKNEWIGDWSDYSNLWRDDLKLKLNYNPQDNCFYMNFKDFKHYFSKIQICKVHENFDYNSIEINQKLQSYSLVKLTVAQNLNKNKNVINNNENRINNITNNFNFKNISINLNNNATNLNTINNVNNLNNSNNNLYCCNQNVYINLIQNEVKRYSLKNTNYKNDQKFSIARIILSKLTYNNEGEYDVEYITGKISQEKELFEEKELEAGNYILFIEVDRANENNNIIDSSNFLEGNQIEDVNNNSNCNDCYFNITEEKNFSQLNKNIYKNNRKKCDKHFKKINKKIFLTSNDYERNDYLKDLFSEEKFVLSAYSNSQIELKLLKNEEFPNILQKIYISCAKKDNNVLRFSNDGAPNCLK